MQEFEELVHPSIDPEKFATAVYKRAGVDGAEHWARMFAAILKERRRKAAEEKLD